MAKKALLSYNIVFLGFLYFIQGLPFGIQTRFLPIHFRRDGMSLANLGYFKLLLIPWMCKALWAPFVDKYKTKKTWLQYSMMGLIFTCFLGSWINSSYFLHLCLLMLTFNILTSVQDIAVDGLAIQILSQSELGYGNIAQVVGFKIGTFFGGGVLTWLSEYISWVVLFISLTLVYLTGMLSVTVFLDDQKQQAAHNEQPQKSANKSDENFWFLNHLSRVFKTDGISWIIFYVLIYKLGEQGVLNLIPLYLVDNKINTGEIGYWTGMVGQVFSIIGSVIGGWISSSKRLAPVQLLKSFSMIRLIPQISALYVVYSWTSGSECLAYATMCGLLFISGIMTTATFTLMMESSQMAPTEIQTTHYTTLATFEVIGKLSFSSATGLLTDTFGYLFMFVCFLVFSLFVIPLLKFVPHSLKSLEQNKNI